MVIFVLSKRVLTNEELVIPEKRLSVYVFVVVEFMFTCKTVHFGIKNL